MTDIAIEKQAFSSPADRGFTAKAWYLKEPNAGDALIEVFRNGEPYRRFLYPACKIWNIAAHFGDIVTSEIESNMESYDLAGWTGFSVIRPVELEPKKGGVDD
jgi:hypothetical protein